MSAALTLTFNTSFGVYANNGAHGLSSGQAVLIIDANSSNPLTAGPLYVGVLNSSQVVLYNDAQLRSPVVVTPATLNTSLTLDPLGPTTLPVYANVYGVYPIYETLDVTWLNNNSTSTWAGASWVLAL